ncbi:MAG: HPr(Ser) kinase/phosphatase [Eubacteriales bacterium]|nr:HPr(Ser) kinase/phosphatase [Eubacteriales bacterium]
MEKSLIHESTAAIIDEHTSVEKLVERMNLTVLTPSIDLSDRMIEFYDVNRAALQLTGFFDHFDKNRVQIIGKVEQQYINDADKDMILRNFERLASYHVPCIVFTRNYEPSPEILDVCIKHGVPCCMSSITTSELVSEIIRWLRVVLAPCISIHGVLMDCYGEGVLILGDSGVGKSEAALELLKRGHRLVTDDVVEIKKVSDETLVGTAPDITKNFIELRGIGIINVRDLFGFEAIKDTQSIDMVIKLEEWDKDKTYDRIGLEENYMNILGKNVVLHEIPVRPGRNIAIIVECAAINHRAKKMGYNAAAEFLERVKVNMG